MASQSPPPRSPRRFSPSTPAVLRRPIALPRPRHSRDPIRPPSARNSWGGAWRWLAARYDKNSDGQILSDEHGRGETAFRNLDRDGDGVVTREDLARDVVLPPELGIQFLLLHLFAGPQAEAAPITSLATALAMLDHDGDRSVSAAEFQSAVESGALPGVDGFGTLLAGMDSDRDSLLSTTEIMQWLLDRDSDGLLALRDREGAAPIDGWFEPEAREPAPDFAAFSLEAGAPVMRNALQQRRPMALIFGSFT
ncbi:MAG: hypothetical protein EXS13_06250 [Planctomycetes bacterium]|nr:hypothetical protein [Planctomycetota bacterium]